MLNIDSSKAVIEVNNKIDLISLEDVSKLPKIGISAKNGTGKTITFSQQI